MKEDTMDGTLGTHEREMHARCWWKYLKARDRSKTSHRWEDNIKMYLQEIGCESLDWIRVAQDRGQ
jgi:hypothetical protein